MTDFADARRNMVDGQIRPNRVTNPALVAAFENVPREQFVPRSAAGIAYMDNGVRIAEGRWLIKPMVLARLIEEAQVTPSDVVLDVCCGTGYSTAILASMADTVIAVEGDGELARSAMRRMAELSFDNAIILEGDPRLGHPPQQPYNVIMMAGAVDHVPPALLAQLSEGGRLVTVIAGRDGQTGTATLFARVSGLVSHRPLFDAAVPLLPGFEPVPSFEF